MRPRNEREREVDRLARKLPPLTDAQSRWCINSTIEWHINYAGKKGWCERCGHEFEVPKGTERMTCPHCGFEFPVLKNRKKTVRGSSYIQIITISGSWQVIRYFLVRWQGRAGERTEVSYQEVIQKWCQPGRPTITRGTTLVFMPNWCAIPYSKYGDMSIKHPSYFYTEWMYLSTYPRMKLMKPYRNTVRKAADFGRYSAEDILAIIYSIPYFETLYKAGKMDELKAIWSYYGQFQKYWPSVKVAIRHGFEPRFWSDYFEYLRMLKYLRKDMHSPRYVAPEDYDDIHTLILHQYQNKIEAVERKRREREALLRAEAEERQRELDKEAKKSFASRIKKFAGLLISSDGISIRPLMSVKEFRDEGKAMHHCVFALGYYKKPDSLILSARDGEGERIETIEVGLHEGTVIQSRGPCNQLTERHDLIVSLVEKNMGMIQEMAAINRQTVSRCRS